MIAVVPSNPRDGLRVEFNGLAAGTAASRAGSDTSRAAGAAEASLTPVTPAAAITGRSTSRSPIARRGDTTGPAWRARRVYPGISTAAGGRRAKGLAAAATTAAAIGSIVGSGTAAATSTATEDVTGGRIDCSRTAKLQG